MEKKFKEFFATSWAIDNKISVYVLVFIIAIFGLINYYTIPKEQIPEIVIPMINVTCRYGKPGNKTIGKEPQIDERCQKNYIPLNPGYVCNYR